ncbi:helix-turn-helix domain-containing protein [Pedobacter rhodius]|uniref:PAS domain S-box protein n=1 Tax=Pedobacter rhodius TaxID=3004098 RepID=A0ABT4L1K0_9SPHI|nr:helix-turn-helix domain-containing protein [Pedobacter sp. SJ11]MCZ4224821.1 PAS domain S-box protein [Pedobacter sp. SJ11]
MNTFNITDTTEIEYYLNVFPEMICISGYDGFFKKMNAAVSRTLGYSPLELMEYPMVSFIHDEDQSRTLKKFEELKKGLPLTNFSNRFIAKDGQVIYLSWTSIAVGRDEVIFSIARDITYRKHLEEYNRVSSIMEKIHAEEIERNQKAGWKDEVQYRLDSLKVNLSTTLDDGEPAMADKLWLNRFEATVKEHAGNKEIKLRSISSHLAMSERQLFRHVKRILNITPNKLVRVIRLQLAWEAIASGKYNSIAEISDIAGYGSRPYFKKLFFQVYGIRVEELI